MMEELSAPSSPDQLILFTASPGPIGVTHSLLIKNTDYCRVFLFSRSTLITLTSGLTPGSQLSLTSQDWPGWKQRHCKNTSRRREFLCVPSSQQCYISPHKHNFPILAIIPSAPSPALSPEHNTALLNLLVPLTVDPPVVSLLALLRQTKTVSVVVTGPGGGH